MDENENMRMQHDESLAEIRDSGQQVKLEKKVKTLEEENSVMKSHF